MPITPYVRPGARDSRRGFALLITITLLSFLVLLLVSLAALTRVETQVASNSQQLAQARQNALLALNVAFGELQRTTGPDRRVTAPANLANAAAASPRWVGVYGNSAAADYTQKPSGITPSSSRLLQWLVSGNENVLLTADSSGTITSATPGFASSTASPSAASPADVVSIKNGDDFKTATATSDLVIGPKAVPARLLVGPNSVDSANAASDFVAAPLVALNAARGSVPGLAATATPVIGGYAWWVSDESTKAKINLRNSYLSQTSAADQTAFQRYSFITAQRSGIDRMDQVSTASVVGGAAADVLDTAYPAMNSAAILTNAISLRQLPFLSSVSATQTKLASALKLRFHDVTAYGSGVLADAYAGGLKKDLTADIANTTTSASGNRPGDGDPLFPKQKPTDHVPTWGLLRSFPRTHPDASGAMDPVVPLMNSSGDYIGGGVSPVINFANFGLDFYLDNSGNIQVAMFPMVILWNPHATQLKASDYELGYHFSTIGGGTNHCRYFIETSATAGGAMSPVATLDLRGGDLVAGGTGVNNPGFIRFKIKGEAMAPGEAQVYILGSSGSAYSPGANTLVRGASPIIHYVSWTIPAMGITAAMFASGEMQARTIPPSSNHAMNVVLAKPGALASWDRTSIGSNWYQAVMDLNAGFRGTTSGGWVYAFPRIRYNSSSLGSSSTGATTTMYASAIMEGHGGFNSSPTFIGAMGTGGGQGTNYRWLVTGNPRAPVLRNTKVENAGFPRGNVVFGTMELFLKQGANTGATGRDPFFPYKGYTTGYNTRIGASQDNGELRAVLFDVLQDPGLLLSVGQLQHAAFGTYGFYPTYSFGNSWADVRIPSEQQYLTDTFSPKFSSSAAAAAYTETLYDLSWHLNRALWDHYFVSGVPSTWTSTDVASGRILPNARMAYYRPNGVAPSIDDLRYSASGGAAYDKAAANLLVDGAFNVNSTSEQAWRSLLGSTLGLPDNAAYATPGAAGSGDSVGTVAAIPRFSGNQAQTGYASTMGGQVGSYLGNRGLMTNVAGTTDELTRLVNELARSIVVEIKARGPFLSVADLVNRRLVPVKADGTADDNGVRGALQAAIDKMGYTSASPVKGNPPAWSPLIASNIPKSGWPASGWNPDHYLGAPRASSVGENANRAAACPKFLTQADLLSLLGPVLTVRGDTFAIRTYGEVRNPITNSIEARAWCEAIVQRLPDYFVAGDSAETAPSALTQADNRTFGRRYRIVSMRWLSPSDI
ncbi:MAG: hypothetical protein JF599_05715 [Verrucomicrobia bacterium]|nr:hypothetical protein [Verrucomicrobiota bacterium]